MPTEVCRPLGGGGEREEEAFLTCQMGMVQRAASCSPQNVQGPAFKVCACARMRTRVPSRASVPSILSHPMMQALSSLTPFCLEKLRHVACVTQ